MNGSIILRQREGLLRGHAACVGFRIVLNIMAGGIGVEPLTDIALVGAGAACKLGGSNGHAVAHGAVKSEAVANEDKRGMHGGAHINNSLMEKLMEFVWVNGAYR